ncbi:MAG: hypothetical protein LBS98_01725 [Coriobacteriales bacterium]|jgi:hypothetical protein|nr:hypothetical protein [Coriobacteriales bacterium]
MSSSQKQSIRDVLRQRASSRLQVACWFLIAFALFLVCLGWAEENEPAEAVGYGDVANSGAVASSSVVSARLLEDVGTGVVFDSDSLLVQSEGYDPLGLVYPGSGFELIGLTRGSSVIGYGCDYPPEQAAQLVKGELERQGWASGSAEASAVMSFTLGQGSGQAGGYLLVQCVAVPGGSSLVIQRM